MPKNVKGALLDLSTYNLLQNFKKLEGEFLKKSQLVPKINPKGDPLGTSGYVGFLEKVKNERGDPLD